MRTLRIRTLAAVCAALLSTPAAAVAQATFQGVVTGSFYDDAGKPVADYTQSIKGQRMRMDMELRGMNVSSLYDVSGETITTLMHAQRVYMVIDLKAAAGQTGTPKPPRITATGRTETIAGQHCEHYLLGDDQDMDVCAAKGMGFGAPQGGGPMGRSPANVPGSYEQLARQFKDGFFPLKMEQVRDGQRRLVMQVKTVQRKAVPDATFALPAGYTEMKVPGMP